MTSSGGVVRFQPAPAGTKTTNTGHHHSSQKPISTRGSKPRMEVTIRNLFGVACNDEGLTASVSFSGSIADMQVGSSAFDPVKGLLAVESEPLKPGAKSLEWPKDQPPHLTVGLEDRITWDAKTSLQKANRDSSFVRETAEDSFRFSHLNSTKSAKSGTDSMFWSDTMAPDIIEFAIRFGDFEGVSYLVFFGHKDDVGSFIVDLPIKSRPNGTSSANLDENARIRVKVNIVVPGANDDKIPPIAACSTSSSEDTAGKSINFPSRAYLEDQIAPLMAIIRNNEENAQKTHYFQKHTVSVEVPEQHDDDAAGSPPANTLCSLGIWEQLRRSVAACSGTSDLEMQRDYSYDDSTVGSTIATRDSWDL